MKKLKLDFQQLNAQVLTSSELKKIIGGVDGSGNGDGGGGGCANSACTVYDSSTGITYSGNCGYSVSGRWGVAGCECLTSLGFYIPNGGVSHCAV